MHHDPGAARLARLKADLLRDERALIAEGSGWCCTGDPELVAMSRNLAGAAGERLASGSETWSSGAGARPMNGRSAPSLRCSGPTRIARPPSASCMPICSAPCFGWRGAPMICMGFARSSPSSNRVAAALRAKTRAASLEADLTVIADRRRVKRSLQ